MIIYRIRNWNVHYENNRTRELKQMTWVPVPNSHDGDGYTELVSRKNGAAMLGAWLVILQVASRCEPRGTLLRKGGDPHTPASLSRITRLPEDVLCEALKLCCDVLQWIETVEVTPIPQEGAEKPQEGALLPQGGDEEGKGKKGRERREENGSKHPSLEEVKLCCSKTGLPDSDAIWFWNKCEANGWTNGGNKIKSWPHTIASWKAAGYLPSQKKNPPKSDRPVGGNF